MNYSLQFFKEWSTVHVFLPLLKNHLGRSIRITYNLIFLSLCFPECPQQGWKEQNQIKSTKPILYFLDNPWPAVPWSCGHFSLVLIVHFTGAFTLLTCKPFLRFLLHPSSHPACCELCWEMSLPNKNKWYQLVAVTCIKKLQHYLCVFLA